MYRHFLIESKESTAPEKNPQAQIQQPRSLRNHYQESEQVSPNKYKEMLPNRQPMLPLPW